MKSLYFITFFLFLSLSFFSQNSLNFDGTNDFVNCGNSPSINITGNALTLEAWIYPTSWRFNIWEGNIISKESSVGTGYMLRVGSNGKLNVNIGSGGPWNELTSSTNVLTLNTWQHVAATFDGSFLRLYVNGVLTDSIAKSVNIVGTVTNNLYLGESPAYSGRYFPGRIDEVRIWDVVRTKNEIVSTMNSEMCNIPSSLKAYYTFNQGIASGTNVGMTSLNDASGNGNTGTLSGFTLSGSTSNWVTGATISPGIRTTLFTDTVCSAYTTPSGRIITTTGITYDTLTSAGGCDSLLMFDISISSVDDSVYRVGGRITSYDTWASHQWVRCDSAFALIAGETNRFIIANQAGDYAVIVSRGNCKDTSDCVSISLTGIEENSLNSISIFPNPANDFIQFESSSKINSVRVFDLNGKLILSHTISNNRLEISSLAKGVYVLEINTTKTSKKTKIIKQ